VGTTTGISTEIVEDVVPQTSSSNPAEMPIVVYGRLLHFLLRGFYFSPTQMEGTWATIGAKYPSARRHRLRLTNTKMIGSLQWQMTGEPPTLYHIKPPPPAPLQAREGDCLPRKLITISSTTHRIDLTALRLNQVGGITRPTRYGSGHPAIPLGYLCSLGRHDQHCGHKGGGTHYLTNDEASMPDNIYPGAETHLITDRDNDLIMGM
jgi:hypothetical protein